MRDDERFRGSDLLPGILAAVALLVMVFLLAVPVILGVILAGLAYLGFWLVVRRPALSQPAAAPPLSESRLLEEIDSLSRSLAHPNVRVRTASIREQVAVLTGFLDEHPSRNAALRPVLRECLESTLRVLHRYADLSRFLDDPTHQTLTEVDTLLEQVTRTLGNMRRQLVEEGTQDLSLEVESVRSTLQALDEVYLPPTPPTTEAPNELRKS